MSHSVSDSMFRAGACPRKVRTGSFAAIVAMIERQAKASGWFSWCLFLCNFLLDKQKKVEKNNHTKHFQNKDIITK